MCVNDGWALHTVSHKRNSAATGGSEKCSGIRRDKDKLG